jgi:Na+(H+)/acetate symporter ActP
METAPMTLPDFVVPVLTDVGTPAVILAVAGGLVRVSRAALLHKAGSTALSQGTEDQRREAGLKIVEALTRERGPWWREILPGRKSGDGDP